jgi:hypothetical protein
MEHLEAIQLKATERYLLGELSGDLREQFEDHFFSCFECAQDVEAGAIFVDSARQILGRESAQADAAVRRPAKPESRGWLGALLRPAFAGPALAVLLVFAAYQNAVLIPRMKSVIEQARTPQIVTSFSLIAQNSRGGDAVMIQVPKDKTFSLFADIPPEKHLSSYTCTVESESGTPQFSLNVPARLASDTIQVSVPPSVLKSGKYFMVVRGADSDSATGQTQLEVARFPFTLTLTN